MGLDVVEVVMRCEEIFGVTLPNADLSAAVTVGGLYDLICKHLELVPLAQPEPEEGVARRANMQRPWTADEVWATLVWVVADQLQVDLAEVGYDARWQVDLGAD